MTEAASRYSRVADCWHSRTPSKLASKDSFLACDSRSYFSSWGPSMYLKGSPMKFVFSPFTISKPPHPIRAFTSSSTVAHSSQSNLGLKRRTSREVRSARVPAISLGIFSCSVWVMIPPYA
eukprot:TRINITY_DN64091_c0_g1_i1.p3 TRINITY_DN64091_c0_g1~~TRINITY_DN64091_c0_g1_i1.p3  ORF type:complete len:121 (+),score=2.18 TRINITY_DN64091_c0_g1_i1:386-748(+)